MHKRLETDLMSLAHEILKMKDKDDVFVLKEKSKQIYEKLSLLAFVEEYVNTTPNLEGTKDELLIKVTKGIALKETEIALGVDGVKSNEAQEKVVHHLIDEPKVVVEETSEKENTPTVPEITEQPFDELESLMFTQEKSENIEEKEVNNLTQPKIPTLEEELEDTISVDTIANLFDTPAPAKSLNDKLSTNIQIGLNDRIAFVKNLFEGSQEDFNRVVSQLNTFKTEKEAKKFIEKVVKPDYNWSDQEELEARFIQIITRRFA